MLTSRHGAGYVSAWRKRSDKRYNAIHHANAAALHERDQHDYDMTREHDATWSCRMQSIATRRTRSGLRVRKHVHELSTNVYYVTYIAMYDERNFIDRLSTLYGTRPIVLNVRSRCCLLEETGDFLLLATTFSNDVNLEFAISTKTEVAVDGVFTLALLLYHAKVITMLPFGTISWLPFPL